MDRLGLDPETVPRRRPRLVNCSISGYGTTGPDKDRKALDLLIQGESGLPSVTGTRAEPCKIGISVAVMCAAMYARSGILAGLRARERTDLGQRARVDGGLDGRSALPADVPQQCSDPERGPAT